MGDQQTGQYMMIECRDCGAAFASRKKGPRARFCPACREAHKKEYDCRYMSNLSRRRQSQTAREAMLARLAARDAEYERGGHAAESRVTVRDGLRVETRGRVCGSPVGAARRIAI